MLLSFSAGCGQALVAIFGVTTLIFFVQRLTGDPTYLLVPETATKADIDALRHALGFDRPLIVQYLDFLRDHPRFDLGRSVVQRMPVVDIIASRVPYTLAARRRRAGGRAAALAFRPASLLALCARPRDRAVLCRRSSWRRRACRPSGAASSSSWSSRCTLGWLPPSSTGGFEHLVMPSIALGLLSMATFARITRTALLDELSKDYVRTARARGVATERLLVRQSRATPRSR